MTSNVISLAGGFAPATGQDWLVLVEKTLKGAGAETLVRRTPDGLAVRPLYTAADSAAPLPFAPSPRGGTVGWDVRATVEEADPAEANANALAALTGGAASILVRVAQDDQAGVALADADGLARVLDGVKTELAPVALDAGFLGPVAAGWLDAAAKASPAALLAFHLDPLSAFARTGASPGPIEAHITQAAATAARLADAYPRASLFLASGAVVHEAGGGAAWEVAQAIASALAYAKALVAAGLTMEAAFAGVTLGLAVDAEPLVGIAKLRAARVLWHRVMTQLGAKDERSKMLRTHCQTSGVSLTEQDPYNNVIRTTIEAMAAMLGGTQSLHTNALDEAIALPTDFSARIARNTQLVIQEETGMCNVVDPLGGSYYIEALTKRLVDDAWEIIQRVEREGGMAKAVGAGWPKAMIEEASAARAARVDRGEDVIVGVNKYRKDNEDPIEILDVDNHAVREAQIRRINKMKAERDEEACRAALDALRDGAKGDGNLLELAVECARRRATLGEISSAMEDVFGRFGTQPTPVKGVYGGAYKEDGRWERLLRGVEAVERRLGRKPRMFVAKMGQDGHDRGANLVSSMFGDLGFEVVPGPLFQTPKEASELALEKDVDVVGASSLAAGHKTLIPELIGHLRDAGRPDIKVIAGGVIPAQDYQALFDAGVQAIFGPGTNLIVAAEDVLRLLGHNMPPQEEAAE